MEGAAEVGRVALGHLLLAHDAPVGLVVVGAEVPLVVDEGLGLVGVEGAALLVHVHERPLAHLGSLGQRQARLLEHVVGECAGRLLHAALAHVQVHLGTRLQHLLEHLLGDLLALRVVGLALALHPELGHHLGELGLELAPVVHVLAGVVLLLALLALGVLRKLVD